MRQGPQRGKLHLIRSTRVQQPRATNIRFSGRFNQLLKSSIILSRHTHDRMAEITVGRFKPEEPIRAFVDANAVLPISMLLPNRSSGTYLKWKGSPSIDPPTHVPNEPH